MKQTCKKRFEKMQSILKRGTVEMLCTILFCLVLQANAQTDNNTIVNDNSSWATLSYGLGAYNIICCVRTEYVYFGGDSIIESRSYKKVFSCDDELHENVNYEGLIREHEKKTYFIPANSEKEYLLYDFSLEEGMNFEYELFAHQEKISLYVRNSDSVLINGKLKKRLQLSLPHSSEIMETWIENLGSLRGFFTPGYAIFPNDGGTVTLLCYFNNHGLIYKNPEFSKCYYDNADDLSVQEIYPNPVDNILTVFSLNHEISKIEFFDISGKKVYSQTYNGTVDISSLSTGLYLLKVYDVNEQVSVFKIIKK